MRRILGLMFHVAMPFLYYSVNTLDRNFDSFFCQRKPQFDYPIEYGLLLLFSLWLVVGAFPISGGACHQLAPLDLHLPSRECGA